MTRHMRHIYLAGLLAAGVAVALTAEFAVQTSRASTAGVPIEVGAAACGGSGGHVTVPAGSTIVIRQRLNDEAQGVLTALIKSQTTIVSVNDAFMFDVSDQWGAPVQQPEGTWRITLRVPTGVTLANPGDQMRFTFAIVLSSTVAGPAVEPSGKAGPGLYFGGTCTVTAA